MLNGIRSCPEPKSNTRVFSYELPKSAEEKLAPAMDTTRSELGAVIHWLFEEHGEEIESVARETQPCEYCETQRYGEFVVRELINRGLTDLSEDGEFDHLRTPK